MTARQVPPLVDPLIPMDQPLPPLGKYLLGTAIALDTMHAGQVPDIDPKTATGSKPATTWPTGKPESGPA